MDQNQKIGPTIGQKLNTQNQTWDYIVLGDLDSLKSIVTKT